MSKIKYEGEFEFKASASMLYSYMGNASGLAEWMADDVNITPEKGYIIIWDDEEYKAKLTHQKMNKQIRLEFEPEDEEDEKDPSYLELTIEKNDLTNATYLKVVDYAEHDDLESAHDLWSSSVEALKDIIGG